MGLISQKRTFTPSTVSINHMACIGVFSSSNNTRGSLSNHNPISLIGAITTMTWFVQLMTTAILISDETLQLRTSRSLCCALWKHFQLLYWFNYITQDSTFPAIIYTTWIPHNKYTFNLYKQKGMAGIEMKWHTMAMDRVNQRKFYFEKLYQINFNDLHFL